MAKKTEEIVPTVQGGPSDIMASYSFINDKTLEAIKENIGGNLLTPYDFDRIKIPAGGGTIWEIPTLAGVEHIEDMQGIIIFKRNNRVYWSTEYTGENTPPDCKSDDGELGFGTPGGLCASCPLAQWGSGKNEGQACKVVMPTFLMRPGNILPVLINIPRSSVGIMRKFFMRLANQSLVFHGVIVSLKLNATKNKTNIKYSEVLPTYVSTIPTAEHDYIKQYIQSMSGIFVRTELVQSDVTDTE